MDSAVVSVWRVVAPPGYGALGDVVSLGLDPPTAPVQARPTICSSRTQPCCSFGACPTHAASCLKVSPNN